MLMLRREGSPAVEELKRQKIALFRFRVIAPLLGLGGEQWGKKEKLLGEITQRQWEIPYSGRSYVGRFPRYWSGCGCIRTVLRSSRACIRKDVQTEGGVVLWTRRHNVY